ncbi:hypothetical protein C8Q78DRAFT_1081196 [Trametes maxima]|nr:hypothetical protein C8Q78DRAFT_1081196 [Trametes maxima]
MDAAHTPTSPAPTGVQTPHETGGVSYYPVQAHAQAHWMTPVRADRPSHADFEYQLPPAFASQTSEPGGPLEEFDLHQPATPGDVHHLTEPSTCGVQPTETAGVPPTETFGVCPSQPPSSDHAGLTQPAQMPMAGPVPVDLSRYRHLAEARGIHGADQLDKAVELATNGAAKQMSPTSARVVIYTDVLICMNLLRKLREQQNKAVWEMSERTVNQMHLIGRYALIAPLPYSWKNEVSARVVLDMLIKDGSVPKDIYDHPERVAVVLKKAGSYASHIRSDVIKSAIQKSLKAPYKNILELTNFIIKSCKGKIELSIEILGGIAYMRSLVAAEMAQRSTTRLDRDMWELFEVRLGDTLEVHRTVEAQSIFLRACLAEDIAKYGSYNSADVRLVATYPALQAATFAAMRTAPGLAPVAPEPAKNRGRRG